ncbi:hypothetical protein [Oceaniovalibus sp. ACAM 378]|nr:hypothetical protein [Oceaniovalibus sp. ACAM 378]
MRISLSALASFALAGAAAVEVTPSISLDLGDTTHVWQSRDWANA